MDLLLCLTDLPDRALMHLHAALESATSDYAWAAKEKKRPHWAEQVEGSRPEAHARLRGDLRTVKAEVKRRQLDYLGQRPDVVGYRG